jgi:tetrahydromethanopterin S-methyltransferase subunit C
MADAPEQRVPQPSEEVHLPEPTYLPVVVAFGITLSLVGILFSWFLTGLGVIITLAAIVRWIRDTRRDVAELPLEH